MLKQGSLLIIQRHASCGKAPVYNLTVTCSSGQKTTWKDVYHAREHLFARLTMRHQVPYWYYRILLKNFVLKTSYARHRRWNPLVASPAGWHTISTIY